MANNPADLLQQLVAAIQQAIPAPANAEPQPVPQTISPYEGGPIDLTSRTGQSLFFEASKPLQNKFTGKSDELPLFVAELKQRARLCRWTTLLTFQVNGQNLHLLDDYGRIPRTAIDDALATRNDLRAKQNSEMMFKCLYDSLSGDAQTRIITATVPEDGPTLFHLIMTGTYTATFAHAQATRDALLHLHPKSYQYDIVRLNAFVRLSVQAINAASGGRGTTDQEILHYLFTAYKKIKAPAIWTNHIFFLESKYGSTPTYTPDDLMAETAAHYQRLKDKGEWRPSDKAPEEQILAMLAGNRDRNPKDSKNGKNRTPGPNNKTEDKARTADKPPFADKPGKDGDTKTFKGKTYYYCSGEHRTGHWVTHKPSECRNKSSDKRTAKKANAAPSPPNNKDRNQPTLQVDRNSLNRAMEAILAGSNSDIDPVAATQALLATLSE